MRLHVLVAVSAKRRLRHAAHVRLAIVALAVQVCPNVADALAVGASQRTRLLLLRPPPPFVTLAAFDTWNDEGSALQYL